MKIHYLGTCSGTEPMEGMHHTSLILEIKDSLYWFDAGENCAYSAYTSGLDVMKTKAIFVSHPHIDHTGGLANLLMLFHKLVGAFKHRFSPDNSIKIFFPDQEVLDCIKKIALGGGSKNSKFPFDIIKSGVSDGVVFEDGNIRVSAVHNRHLGEKEISEYRSFSYLIEAEGKRIVYSGDVASSEELDPLLASGCDYLIHETGHHKVRGVLDYALSRRVKALRFTHHGREIIRDRNAAKSLLADACRRYKISAEICYDGMTEEI